MRLSTKIMLWAWIILILTIGSLIYSAYSKLRPESLVSLLNGQIESNYPGSKLTIGKIRYAFSLDFDLTLNDLELRKSDELLASATQVQLKVPWWLILLDRGSAQINLSDLNIFIRPSDDLTEQVESSTQKKDKLQAIKLNLPTYLKDAIYTLRAKNISIKELDGERRFFTLSKLLVRDFQYGKNSAFEINIPVNISHKEKHYSSDLWLFGDLTPSLDIWSFNYRGEFKTKDAGEGLQLDDLVLQGITKFNPLELDFLSELELKVDQKTVGSGSILARDNKMTFDLSFVGFPLSYLNLVGDELKNPYLDLKKGRANGKLKYVRSLKNDDHSLISSKLTFPGDFNLGALEKFKGQWSLSIENDKWETNFITPNGEVSFFKRSVIDFERGKIKQSTEELGFAGVDFLNSLTAVQNFGEFHDLKLDYFSTTYLSLKKCKLKDQLVDGHFKYSISPFENFYQVSLVIDKSKFNFDYLFKNDLNSVSFEAIDFDWHAQFGFLAPYLKLEGGLLSGKVLGSWSHYWTGGKWESSLKFTNYKQLSGMFFDPIKRAFLDAGLDIDQSQYLFVSAKLDKNNLKFTNSSIMGTDSKVFDGNFSFTSKEKSFFEIKDPKNKIKKGLKKEVLNPFNIEG
jgi:hypothetical protein